MSSSKKNRWKLSAGIVMGAISIPLVVFASPLDTPHQFESGGRVLASEFNENFLAIEEAVNDIEQRLQALETAVGDEPGGLPSGAVVFFNGEACPAGWIEMTALRGRVPVGLPLGGMLGAEVGLDLEDEGLRTISEVPVHTHIIDPPTTPTSTDGLHFHSVDPPITASDTEPAHNHSANPLPFDTSTDGAHTHVVNNGNGGVDSAYLQAANSAGDGAVADSSAPIFSAGNHFHAVDVPLFWSSSAGAHSHTTNIPAFNSVSSGNHSHMLNIGSFNSASAGTGNVDVTMPYIQLLACQRV